MASLIKADFLVAPDGKLLGFKISGHANFADTGNDIVCAAVSSAVYMAANTITEVLHLAANAEAREDSGEFCFRVSNRDCAFCTDILLGLKIHLLGLEEQYPDNIKVNYMEV